MLPCPDKADLRHGVDTDQMNHMKRGISNAVLTMVKLWHDWREDYVTTSEVGDAVAGANVPSLDVLAHLMCDAPS